MKIIHDDETFGLAMIPLFVFWGIRRCNVDGCTNKPSTIISGLAPDIPTAGFCEQHYQETCKDDGATFDLVFDDFDAFQQEERE